MYTKHSSTLILGGTNTTSANSIARMSLDCDAGECEVITTGIAKDATITTLDTTVISLSDFLADTSVVANWSADIVHFSSAGIIDADAGDMISTLNGISTDALIVQSMGTFDEYSQTSAGISDHSDWQQALSSSNLVGNTIFVGAVDMIDDKNTSAFSEGVNKQYNQGVGGFAQGSGLLSSGRGASVHYADNFVVDFGADGYGGFAVANASARVAGKAALLMQKFPTQSAGEIKARILSTATDLGAVGVDSTYGHGLVNLSRAMSL